MLQRASRSLFFLLVLGVSTAAVAQVPNLCPGGSADWDLDGLSDASECAGIALAPGLQLQANAATFVPNCGASGALRSLCVDPASRDVFVIDQPAPGHPLPSGSFEALLGLGMTQHTLVRTTAGTDRTVTGASTQKSIQVVTDPDSVSGVLGRANWGTPNNLDGATVYPNRVTNYVNGLCPASKTCKTHTGLQAGPAAIAPVLTRWVANHEAGHTLALTSVYDDRYGGYHEPAGALTVMEQTTKVVDKRGQVTFYIADTFSSASVSSAAVAGQQ
jgi:hypothetical protein